MTTRALTSTAPITIRHIHPDPAGPHTLLGLTLAATWLPDPKTPTSSCLVEGACTLRLDDAGEFTLTFPNSVADDGVHWMDRFSPELGRDWVEIYRGGVLDLVGQVQRVEIDRGRVTVSGPDGWALLRRAYERDRTWTAAPRDVINAYTRVPVPVVVDENATLGWTVHEGTVTVSGGQVVATTDGDPIALSNGFSFYRTIPTLGQDWRTTFTVAAQTGTLLDLYIVLRDGAASPTGGYLSSQDVTFRIHVAGYGVTLSAPASGGDIAVTLPMHPYEALPLTIDVRGTAGRWIAGYANGRLIGFVPWRHTTTRLRVYADSASPADVVRFGPLQVTDQQQLLARGTDMGDAVLPGAYPTGGLRGRYWNDADLMGLDADDRYARRLAPDRTPYTERLDPVIDTSAGLTLPPTPGAAATYFAARWSGAVYLPLADGDVGIRLTNGAGGARVWVGDTAWGNQIIDDWTGFTTSAGTAAQATLGGESGWVPIVVEFQLDTGSPGITLQLNPAAGYTDPGGTAITGSTWTTIPATSLSPLGCYDNRVQGTAHFDVVQQAAQQFGYQLRCEPMSLESGEFPGRLVPRVRVGRDTDRVLEVDDTDHANPVLQPGVTIDASDQTLTLIGSGAGIADGAGGQVTVEISDLAGMADSLFATEGQVDAGDIAFPSLLAARLNAELDLRRPPWEEVRGTPLARDELADTWPLTGTLAAMRWEPGDGIRLHVPDIHVIDTEPRQITQVTRTFVQAGVTGTQVGFRQRPRTQSEWVRRNLRAAMSGRRNYQGQVVTLPGELIAGSVGAGGFSGYSRVPLLPTDRVVRAYLRIVANSAGHDLAVEVNGNDQTTALGGPWSVVPVEIPLRGYATQASTSDNRLYARIQNTEGSSTTVEAQLIVEVLR